MITGIAIVKKALAEVKKESEKFFQGELTISKRDCWLIGAILVLLGVAIGFINAPLTHGININIGSGNASGNRTGIAAKEEAEGEDVDKEKLCKPDASKKEKDMVEGNRRNTKIMPVLTAPLYTEPTD